MFSLLIIINGQAPFNLNFRTEAAALKAKNTLHEEGSYEVRKIEDHYGQTFYFVPGGLIGTVVQNVELVMKAQIELTKLQNKAQRDAMSAVAIPSTGLINLGARN